MRHASRRVPFALLLVAAAAAGCKSTQDGSAALEGEDADAPAQQVDAQAALGALGVNFDSVGEVQVIVQNTVAFWTKMDAVKVAARTVDLAYYLFDDGYAGSYLGKLLVERANANPPVKIRIMVDAKTSSGHRAFFKMLMQKGNGNIDVSYFRPIPQVVLDDFRRLGLDPKKFVPALLAMDTASLSAQVAASSVAQASPALKTDLLTLVRLLTHRSQQDVAAVEAGAPSPGEGDPDGGSMLDAMIAAQFLKVAANLRQTQASLGLKATGRDWFDVTKWTHHKLLIVDGEDFIGGGRNLEDAYHWEKDHVIRVQENIKKYVFMDVDYHVNNAAVATKAETTFDGYLDPDCFREPPMTEACETQIPMAAEVASSAPEAEPVYKEMVAKADKLEGARNYTPTYEPIHKGVLKVANAKVAYAENRMFPDDTTSGKLLYEEPSQHNAALVALIDRAGAGEDVVFQNAYVYFPSGIQTALIRALKRGVNVTVISNSPVSSDLGFVAQAARLQYRPFLEMNAAGPGKFSVFEYMSEESLHAKVEIISDRYLVIGSINADPRCEYLDTNNGVVIDSGELAAKYKTWLFALRDRLINERTRTMTAADGSTRTVPLMRAVDLALIDQEDQAPSSDAMTNYHRSLKPMAKASFLDGAEGAKARSTLQSLFLQY